MSRRIDLPADAVVEAAVTEVIDAANERGTTPTVTAVARRVGLTNSTFWRHFPQHAQQLLEIVRAERTQIQEPASSGNLAPRLAALNRQNRRLSDHLDLAVANIARLTLENQQLRQALEAASGVTVLTQQRPGAPTPTEHRT